MYSDLQISLNDGKMLATKSGGTERSQYTMVSSTISLDHKGTRHNIAYLKVMSVSTFTIVSK